MMTIQMEQKCHRKYIGRRNMFSFLYKNKVWKNPITHNFWTHCLYHPSSPNAWHAIQNEQLESRFRGLSKNPSEINPQRVCMFWVLY